MAFVGVMRGRDATGVSRVSKQGLYSTARIHIN